MNEKPTLLEQWEDCPAGSLDQVVRQAKRVQRHQALRKLSAIGALSCVVVIAYAIVFTSGPTAEYPYGNISCAEVLERIEDYRANRVSPELAKRIATHLEQCPVCRQGIVRHVRTIPTRSVAGMRRVQSDVKSRHVVARPSASVTASDKPS